VKSAIYDLLTSSDGLHSSSSCDNGSRDSGGGGGVGGRGGGVEGRGDVEGEICLRGDGIVGIL